MVDRRTVLQAAGITALGLAALPGCRSDQDADSEPSAPPDEQQTDELALVAAYDRAIAAAGPAAAAQYRAIRDDHAAHLRALGWDQAPDPQSPGQTRPSRRELVRAERRATRLRTRAARVADPDQNQILALIAASEAQHVVTLESL